MNQRYDIVFIRPYKGHFFLLFQIFVYKSVGSVDDAVTSFRHFSRGIIMLRRDCCNMKWNYNLAIHRFREWHSNASITGCAMDPFANGTEKWAAFLIHANRHLRRIEPELIGLFWWPDFSSPSSSPTEGLDLCDILVLLKYECDFASYLELFRNFFSLLLQTCIKEFMHLSLIYLLSIIIM